MLYSSAEFQADVFQTPESRPRKAVACLKKTRIKSTKMAVKPILGQTNALRLPNKRYQKLQLPTLTEIRQSECPSPKTFSTEVAATRTNASDAISTTFTIKCIRITPLFSDLATLIYATGILYHLMSKQNLELNFYKNLFCKFFYLQLILFLDNAFSTLPH